MTRFEVRSTPVLFVAAAAAVVMIAALFFGGSPIPGTDRPGGPAGRSAIAYGALVSWLDSAGPGATVSVSKTSDRAGVNDVVLVLEPSVETPESRARATSLLWEYWTYSRLVVVLPKWTGAPDPKHPGWVNSTSLVPTDRPESLLAALFEVIDVATPADGGPLILRLGNQPPRSVDSGRTASIDELQTMRSDLPFLQPLIVNESGVLAALLAEDFLVISDPDLLNNAGIGRGENAALVHALLRTMTEPEHVWVDESIHRPAGESVWRELLRFPLVLLTLQFVLFSALAAWAATQRFGPHRSVEPRYHRGRESFLAHTAELLQLAGHGADSLVRYLALAEAEVSRSLGWGDLPIDEREERLRSLRSGTDQGESFASLTQDVRALTAREITPHGLLSMAQRIDRWRRQAVSGRSFHGPG